MRACSVVFVAVMACGASTMPAAGLDPIKESCTLSVGDKAEAFRLGTDYGDCDNHRHCGSSMSDVPVGRFSGISIPDLVRQGAQLTATLEAEAGRFTCYGTVKESELVGVSIFTPSAEFVTRMEQMGFKGFDAQKLLAYALLDVRSDWARSLKEMGIRTLTTDNLIALHIFHVDKDYVRSITSLGYPQPDAEQLVAVSCQGVNAAEVREIRALGYQPTLDQLVQIRIFKITPDFIRRMQARGFSNLTLEKLVQIRIFKLVD